MAILADHLLVPSRTLWVTAFIWPEWLFSSQQNMALNVSRKEFDLCDETTWMGNNWSTFECIASQDDSIWWSNQLETMWFKLSPEKLLSRLQRIRKKTWRFPNKNFLRSSSSNVYLSNSNISGLSQTRCFMRSCIAVMTDCALSSAPCLELFSAAPAKHTTN